MNDLVADSRLLRLAYKQGRIYRGFRKVDPDRWEFANEGFLRGQKHLLKTINRSKPSFQGNSQPQQPQMQNAPVPSCVEVGKFGLEEEIERLKRDKNVLMQELVRLRQQQQTTDHQLQTLGKRLQGMESRQQHMMSFLAKAMQSPGFLAQFVRQNENSRTRIVAANKKRQLPKGGCRCFTTDSLPRGFPRHGLDSESAAASLDGQIIMYQPLINEAAKAMLRKILKLDSSHRFESMGNSDNNNFLLENYMPAAQAFESSSSTRNSGVTLAEVPANSGLPYVSASSGLSAICSPSVAPEIQCPVVLDNKSSNQVPNMSAVPPVSKPITAGSSDIIIPGFSDLADLVTEDFVNIPGGAFQMPGPEFLSWRPRSDLSLQLHAAGMSDTSKPKPADDDAPPPHEAMVLAVRLRLDHPAAASSTSRPAVTPADVHADAKD
ncbi:heat stress transcription factor A-1-like [Miscanthus floridulus]|uniref:heat stress transcription factor A-1-like n=1 Tax=Miscanthus floridulus TaxID=154761 RepID=UPI00345879E4